MTKIALIGGSGFVGTHLLHQLQKRRDCELLNIDKQQSADFSAITIRSNVLDKEALKLALKGVDVVVLLAAEHRDDVSPTKLYYDVNVQGMKNTLEVMDLYGIKHIIFTSTVAVYGLNKVNPNEETAVAPFNHYGSSKWQAEQELQRWWQGRADCRVDILRPTVIFGEGNRGNVYNLLAQIAAGRFLMIGKGDNRKSMSYIRNIVAFIEFLIFANKQGFEVYNYVDKPDFTTNDLVVQTGKALNKQIPTVRIPYSIGLLGAYCFDALAWLTRQKLAISSIRVKKFCAVTQFDSNKAMASGFVPPFSMEEGLRNTLQSEFKVE